MSRHLLYIHQYFIEPKTRGGGTRSYEAAKRMVAEGIRVTMLTSDQDIERTLPAREIVEGIDVVRIHCPYDNSYGPIRKMLAFARFSVLASWTALRLDYDAMFATSTPLTIGIPALLARWIRRKKYVFEVRDLWPEMPVAVGSIKNKAFIRTLLVMESVIYRNATALVGLSPGMTQGVEDVLEKAGVERPVFTAPNACDFDRFWVPQAEDGHSERRTATRKKYNVADDQIMLLYAGTFGVLNDLEYACDLAAAMKDDPRFVFVLAGDGFRLDAIKARVENEGLDNVRVPGRVSKDDAADLFMSTTIGLSLFTAIPEMEKTSANKFFDTLAAGKPALLNYGGWQAEFINEHEIGQQLPRDITAARRALLAFVENDIHKITPEMVHSAAHAFSRETVYGEVRKALDLVLPPVAKSTETGAA